MSASPNPLNLKDITPHNQFVIPAPSSISHVTESSKPAVQAPAHEETSQANLGTRLYPSARASHQRWSVYFFSWLLASLLAGVIAGRLLYSLWQHLVSHEQQLAQHHRAIQELTKEQTQVSDQAGHLKVLDARVDTLQTLFNEQSKRLVEMENGQARIRNHLKDTNQHWQKQIDELHKDWEELHQDQALLGTAPTPKTEHSGPAQGLSASPRPSASEPHNETFNPDLKPTPTSYAQMRPNGLVVWMTPRPGFPKPVPTSVIGPVRGLGMLVHDWDDNQHYFITASGSWLVDQR